MSWTTGCGPEFERASLPSWRRSALHDRPGSTFDTGLQLAPGPLAASWGLPILVRPVSAPLDILAQPRPSYVGGPLMGLPTVLLLLLTGKGFDAHVQAPARMSPR